MNTVQRRCHDEERYEENNDNVKSNNLIWRSVFNVKTWQNLIKIPLLQTPIPTKIPLEHAKMMNIHEFTQSLDAFQNGHQTEENGNQAPWGFRNGGMASVRLDGERSARLHPWGDGNKPVRRFSPVYAACVVDCGDNVECTGCMDAQPQKLIKKLASIEFFPPCSC